MHGALYDANASDSDPSGAQTLLLIARAVMADLALPA
jgi:hypothetical protein